MNHTYLSLTHRFFVNPATLNYDRTVDTEELFDMSSSKSTPTNGTRENGSKSPGQTQLIEFFNFQS